MESLYCEACRNSTFVELNDFVRNRLGGVLINLLTEFRNGDDYRNEQAILEDILNGCRRYL